MKKSRWVDTDYLLESPECWISPPVQRSVKKLYEKETSAEGRSRQTWTGRLRASSIKRQAQGLKIKNIIMDVVNSWADRTVGQELEKSGNNGGCIKFAYKITPYLGILVLIVSSRRALVSGTRVLSWCLILQPIFSWCRPFQRQYGFLRKSLSQGKLLSIIWCQQRNPHKK